MRRKIIAGNWKMHKTIAEAVAFIEVLGKNFPRQIDIEAWIAPPFTALEASASLVKELGLHIPIGGQNMHEAAHGAFTGEISGTMLKEVGCSFCILGHSERRHLFYETDQLINAKVRRALEIGLTPILCIGEKEQERERGEYMGVMELQLAAGLAGIETSLLQRVVIAYEPVWAIGTGKTATPEIAQETHRRIRLFLAKRWGESMGKQLSILYGGSVKKENIEALLGQPDIDGALIGGASLEAEQFIEIIKKVAKQ